MAKDLCPPDRTGRAYEMVTLLEQKGEQIILKKLEAEVKNKDRSRGKKHEVWIEGFDVKECRTEKFILQKLIYIHENPVRGRRVPPYNLLNYDFT